MPEVQLLIYPNELLHKISEPVVEFDKELLKLAYRLQKVMERFNGVGLSAPQLGVHKRVFVTGLNGGRVMVNPLLTAYSAEQAVMPEGCLSIPGFVAKVKRPASCVVEYQDLRGVRHGLKLDGIDARVVQHENDHLDGKLFVDGLSQIKRQRFRSWLKVHRHLSAS